jgi:hypothetical protein
MFKSNVLCLNSSTVRRFSKVKNVRWEPMVEAIADAPPMC